MVHLIDDDKHGLFAPPEHVGDGIIQIGDTGGYIYHKKDDRGFLNGNHHLLADGRLKYVVRAMHVASRIDNGEFVTRPFALAVMPIACHAAEIVDNCPPAFCQPVIQRRFTDVWPSYYCDDVCHKLTKVRIRNGKRISLLSVAPKYRRGRPDHWTAEAPYSGRRVCPATSSSGKMCLRRHDE